MSEVRNRFSGRVPVVVDCSVDGVGKAKQSMKDECDINNIVAKYERTGQITHIARAEPRFGFCPALDFREALALVQAARDSFMDLPSKARKFFDHDPAKFMEYLESSPKLEELRELGLAKEVVAAIAEKAAVAAGPAPEGSDSAGGEKA